MRVPSSPTGVRSLVPRPRLLRLLAGSWKAAVLSAPAGYGKTTLATQYASRHDALFCRLHPEDRDVDHLLGTLLSGGARLRPPALRHTQQLFASRRDMERDGGLLTASLLDELIPAKGQRLVVLEDLHAVADARESVQWLARIVEESGPRVRFLLTCRGECPLPLARLDLQGGTLILRTPELEFTPREEDRLLRQGHLRLSPEERSAFREALGGWAAGLVLAAQRIGHTGRAPSAVRREADEVSSRRLLAFLAEEVYAPLPSRLQRALCRAAYLDDLEPEAVRFLLGPKEGRFLLREIARRDLFVRTLPDGGPAPRFHRLFRDYLREQWKRHLNEGERGILLTRLARFWKTRGEPLRAIRILLEAGAVPAAIRLFDVVAASEAARRVNPSLGSLALDLVRRNEEAEASRSPWVSFHAAAQLRGDGAHEDVVRLSRRAQDLFLQRRSYLAAVRAFRQEATAAVMTGMHLEAIRRGGEVQRRLPGGERTARGILASEIGNLWLYAGEPERARRILAGALRLLRDGQHAVDLAEISLRQAALAYTAGRWNEYLTAGQVALGIYRRASLYSRVQSLLINMANACLYQGEAERALSHLDESRGLRALSGFPINEVHERVARARALGDLGRFAEAAREFARAREVARRFAKPFANLELEAWSGILERKRSHLPAAEKVLARAVAGFAEMDSPSWLAFVRMELALVRGLRGATAEALRELSVAARVTRRLGDRKELAANLLYQARVLQVAGREFERPFLQALRILVHEDHLVLLRQDADVSLPLLAELRRQPRGNPLLDRAPAALPEALRVRLEAAAPRAALSPQSKQVVAPVTGRIATRRVSVTLRFLGGFEIRVGDRQVGFERRASEALVALLALRRGAPVSREVLAEALWPGAKPEASRNRFDVTLSSARRALEPEAGSRGPFRLLLSEAGLCRLGPDLDLQVDVEEFERRARACEPILRGLPRDSWGNRPPMTQAEARLAQKEVQAAVAAYGGDLLPGLPYASWTQSERDRLRDRFHRLLLAGGALALILGRAEDARQSARRVLEDDPLREEAQRLLLQSLALEGERAAVLRTYKLIRRRMLRELGAPPSAETTALVRGLLEANS